MSPYLPALVLTVLVELAVVAVWLRYDKTSVDAIGLMIFVIGLNLITHPLAWMAWSFLGPDLWLVELLVIIAEAVGLCVGMVFSAIKATALSIAMNVVSTVAGLTIAFYLFDYVNDWQRLWGG